MRRFHDRGKNAVAHVRTLPLVIGPARTSRRISLPSNWNPNALPCSWYVELLTMQIDEWLKAAKEDAVKRRLPELVPLLEGLASSTSALRSADDAQRMRAEPGRAPEPQRH